MAHTVLHKLAEGLRKLCFLVSTYCLMEFNRGLVMTHSMNTCQGEHFTDEDICISENFH